MFLHHTLDNQTFPNIPTASSPDGDHDAGGADDLFYI